MLSRRELLAGASGLVLAPNALAILERANRFSGKPDDEDYWAEVRKAFNVESSFLFLNYGGAAPSNQAVRTSQAKWMTQANQAPSYYLFRKQDPMLNKVRERIAKFFKCDAEEIAITPNASYGLFSVICGVEAERGDTLMTTAQEYPRVLTAFSQRDRRYGTKTVQVELPAMPKGKGDLLNPFLEKLSLKPKLLCTPRVGFLNGNQFPSAEICSAARKAKTFSLIDGAHGTGVLDDSPATLGCDAYATCLHKWMLGPLGTGFLYVRRDRIKDIWSLNPSDPGLESDIRKFEQYGTKNTGSFLAILEAIDAHDAIGTTRKAARLRFLNHYWTSRLAAEPRIHLNTNLAEDMSSSLVNISVEGHTTSELSGWLMDKKKIFVTSGSRGNIEGIRVSPQVFTSLRELDQLVAALLEAARTRSSI